jgi:hypothetical protein
MNELKKALAKAFGKNLVQAEEFPLAGCVQIVLKLKPEKRWLPNKPLQLLDSYSRDNALKTVHKLLAICNRIGIERDLRIALKLQTNVTVTDMVFEQAAVTAYEDSQDLEAIARKFHIVSGLK